MFWTSSEARRQVVVVVENESLIRISGPEMVADAGDDVVEAGNAEEAIAIEARGDPYRLHRHPDAWIDERPQTCRVNARQMAPDQARCHIGRVTIGKGDLPEGGLFIPKPYTAARIAEVLEGLAAPS